jgi:hypothetical protein
LPHRFGNHEKGQVLKDCCDLENVKWLILPLKQKRFFADQFPVIEIRQNDDLCLGDVTLRRHRYIMWPGRGARSQNVKDNFCLLH